MLDYTNLFSLNKYEKNDKIRLKYFQQLKRLRWKKSTVLFVVSTENQNHLNITHFQKKTLVLSIICIKYYLYERY